MKTGESPQKVKEIRSKEAPKNKICGDIKRKYEKNQRIPLQAGCRTSILVVKLRETMKKVNRYRFRQLQNIKSCGEMKRKS